RRGQTVTLSATLRSLSDNTPLVNRDIIFRLDIGVLGTAPTDLDGIARFPLTIDQFTRSGTYPLVAEFAGDGLRSACIGVATLTIDKSFTDISVSPRTGRIGETVTLAGRLHS